MFGIYNQPKGFHLGAWVRDGAGQPLQFDSEADAQAWLNANRATQLELTNARGWPDAEIREIP